MNMVLAQAGTGGLYAVSLAIVVAAVYLAIVRFMDINEKEPLWAVGLLFLSGVIFSLLLRVTAGSRLLVLEPVAGPVALEVGRFVALAVGILALGLVARSRGWSEINGPMDGVVYGTAVGFGFATGEAFMRALTFGGALPTTGPLDVLWTTALTGLSEGVFGGIIGAGFGLAMVSRGALRRAGYPVAALVGAVVLHLGYVALAQGNALGGESGLIRAWVSLAIPVLVIGVVIAIAISRERRAIRHELAEESDSGIVDAEDLRLLGSFAARRTHYATLLMKGDFAGWLATRELHNRQVQLALAKQRARGTNAANRSAPQEEIERLRASITGIKSLRRGGGSTIQEGR